MKPRSRFQHSDRTARNKPAAATVALSSRIANAMPRRRSIDHHNVYVVLLSERVWNEPAFRKANPQHDIVKPCVYVGMTGLDPDMRFDRHMAGVQANRFVLRYGVRLMPELYEFYNPMPYNAACEMEVELAIGLRDAGYAVWQA